MTNANGCVKVGLIGCGQAAIRGHLPALKYVHNAKVVAVADIDSVRLKQVADQFDIPRSYMGSSELLDDSEVEAVAVCVPTKFHVEVASAVLDAGKHLFLEKPLALSLNECDKLIQHANRHSCVAMMGFNMRWHRLVRKARDFVLQRGTGPIRMIRTVFACQGHKTGDIPEWRKHRELGGGGLVDIAIHDFDLWRFLINSEVEEIFAISHSEESDDEVVSVVARMVNGVIVSSSIIERTGSKYEVEIFGLHGRLQISCFCFDGLRFFPDSCRPGDARVRFGGIRHTLRELPRALLRRGGLTDYYASFVREWEHFVECVRYGRTPECTLVDGRRALETLLAATKSASVGRPIKIVDAPKDIHHFRKSDTNSK
jgi:myo-inositol 2-dehydrogenase/D-chiro-inositol 1-dehydrogenase